MKGWRTITYQGVKALVDSGIFAVLLTVDWQTAGFSAKTAIWIALALSLIDKAAGVYLRFKTTTPVGAKV